MKRFNNNGRERWGASRPDTFPNGSSRRQHPVGCRDPTNYQRQQFDESEFESRPMEEMRPDDSVGNKLDRLMDRMDKLDAWREETDRRFEDLERAIPRVFSQPLTCDDDDEWEYEDYRRNSTWNSNHHMGSVQTRRPTCWYPPGDRPRPSCQLYDPPQSRRPPCWEPPPRRASREYSDSSYVPPWQPRFTNVESSSIYGQPHFTSRDSSYVLPRQYKTSTIRQPTYSSDVPPRNPPEMDRLKLFDSDGISSDDDLSKIEINQEFAKNKKREELHRYEALKKQGRVDSSASDSEESSSGDEELKKPSKKTDANFFEVLITVKNQDPILREQDAKLFESDDEDSDEEEDNASMKKGKPMYLKDVVSKQLIKAGPELSDEEDGSGDDGENNMLKSYSHEQKELRKQIVKSLEEGKSDDNKELPHGGFMKCLLATKTFNIGLNMPANPVVFTNVQEFDGDYYVRRRLPIWRVFDPGGDASPKLLLPTIVVAS